MSRGRARTVEAVADVGDVDLIDDAIGHVIDRAIEHGIGDTSEHGIHDEGEH